MTSPEARWREKKTGQILANMDLPLDDSFTLNIFTMKFINYLDFLLIFASLKILLLILQLLCALTINDSI